MLFTYRCDLYLQTRVQTLWFYLVCVAPIAHTLTDIPEASDEIDDILGHTTVDIFAVFNGVCATLYLAFRVWQWYKPLKTVYPITPYHMAQIQMQNIGQYSPTKQTVTAQ